MAALARLRRLRFAYRVGLVMAAALAVVAVTLSVPPLPQPDSFHDFVDKRPLAGIPNFGNVASNLGFLVAGLAGLMVLRSVPAHLNLTRLPYYALALALIGVCLGSGYYHWEPTTPRLYWDRLSMTAAFMSLSAAIVADRVDRRTGLALLPALLLAGVLAATHWRQSEFAGAGDLRIYFLVQFVPALCLPLIVLLFADRIGHERYLFWMLGLYALAMLLEQGDRVVYRTLGGGISGHALKHLAAALGAYMAFHRLREAAR